MKKFLAMIALFASSAQTLAVEQSTEAMAKSLSVIADFADRLCQTVPITTGTNAIELTASAKADVLGLLKKLAELGVAATAKYGTTSSQNVLQADLAKVLRESRDCRIQVWRDLQGRFEITHIGKAPSSPPASAARQVLPKTRLPNVSGAYSRQDAEIAFTNWQYQNCTIRLVKHENLELRGSDARAETLEGDLHVFFSARISYDAANTTDVFRSFDSSYRSPKAACEALHPQLEEYNSLITITSSATGFAYEELVQSPSVRQPTLQRKEGDRWPGTIKFLNSNRTIEFDKVRIFTRV